MQALLVSLSLLLLFATSHAQHAPPKRRVSSLATASARPETTESHHDAGSQRIRGMMLEETRINDRTRGMDSKKMKNIMSSFPDIMTPTDLKRRSLHHRHNAPRDYYKQWSIRDCRCLYPGEGRNVYSSTRYSYVRETVLPHSHVSCQNIKSLCPGDQATGFLWTCPLNNLIPNIQWRPASGPSRYASSRSEKRYKGDSKGRPKPEISSRGLLYSWQKMNNMYEKKMMKIMTMKKKIMMTTTKKIMMMMKSNKVMSGKPRKQKIVYLPSYHFRCRAPTTPKPIAPLNTKPSIRFNAIRQHIIKTTFSDANTIDTPGTAQNLAARWLADDDLAKLDPDDDFILQRYSLATLFFSSYDGGDATGTDVEWNNMEHWMTDKGICMWFGVTCPPRLNEGIKEVVYNENNNILHLNLTDNNIIGTFPSEIAALENLITLDMARNRLEGTIPLSITTMQSLSKSLSVFSVSSVLPLASLI